METLHADVSAAVAAAAAGREDAAVTFDRVRALAARATGAEHQSFPPAPPGRKRAPRLTEPWFC